MRLILLIAVFLLAGCTRYEEPPANASASPSATAPMATWVTKAAIPTPRTEVTCAAADANIWAVGGFDASNLDTRLFHEYDVGKDAWTQRADFPLGVHHTGLVAYKGNVYLLGGYTGRAPFVGLDGVWQYAPATNQWTVYGRLNEPRGAHATILVGSEVYLVGGASMQPGGTTYASTEVYNLDTKTTKAGPTLSATREHLAGAFAGGQIVAAGGRRMSLSNFDTTETLRPGGSQWTQAEPMPTARGGNAASGWGDEVVVFGGERSGGTHAEAEVFNATTGAWSTYPPMPTARHGLCAATLEDGIHVIAGGPQPGLSASGVHEVLTRS